MFEPYATTKPKGTGSGSAGGKKDRRGASWQRNPSCNLESGGARICVWLPVLSDGEEGNE
jgi:nitrogen fixation/metabolism regulation signal transduction histidine kinase